MEHVLDEDYGTPDAEHVDLVFQGLVDTVSGNESMALTYPQQYLFATLQAAGVVNRQEAVTGCEGFVSKIGDAVTKAWEYIKGLFKKIFDFFFGGKAKKKEQAVNAILDEIDTELTKMEKAMSPNADGQTLSQALDHAIAMSIAAQKGEGGNKEEVKRIHDQLQTAKKSDEPAKKAEAVKEAVKELPEHSEAIKMVLDEATRRAGVKCEAFAKLLEDFDPERYADGGQRQYAKKLKAGLTDSNVKNRATTVKGATVMNIKTIADGKKVIADLKGVMKDFVEDRELIQEYKTELDKDIKGAEDRLANFKSTGENVRGNDINKELENLKSMLTFLTSVETQLDATYNSVKERADKVGVIFGIS